MQLELALLYFALWLLMLWLGSVGLEATGMERSRAHFQALSALSGTGFTTRDSETVVNHSSRRWIVTWLMFFGNAGFITVLILIIISVQSSIGNISVERIVIILTLVFASGLFIWLGMVDRVSHSMVRFLRKRKFLLADVTDWDIVHRKGDYGVFRIAVNHRVSDTATLSDSPFCKPTINILALEREGEVIPSPAANTGVQHGDTLLCYGKVKEILEIAKTGPD